MGYLIILLIILSLFFFKRKNLKYYFIIIVFILAIVAFNFEPSKEYDLYRHFNMLDNCRLYGFNYIINHPDYENLPVGATYFYLSSLIPTNGFLPMVTTIISYMSVFIIINKFIEEKEWKKSAILLAIFSFLCMYNYLGLISGIRNKICISIVFYILYKDLIEKKNFVKCMIGYIALALFHPSIFVVIALRLLLLVKDKKLQSIIKILLLLWSFLKNVILSILSKFNNFSIVSYIVTKMNSYDLAEATAVANVPLYTFVYFTRNVIILLIFLEYYRKNKNNKRFETYLIFSSYLICFVFGALREYHFFIRMSELLLLVSLPITIAFFSYTEPKKSIYPYSQKIYNTLLKLFLIIESILFLIFYIVGQYQILL